MDRGGLPRAVEYMNRKRERVERVLGESRGSSGDGRVKERGHRLKVEFCQCSSVPPPCITIFSENEENEDSRNQKRQLFF